MISGDILTLDRNKVKKLIFKIKWQKCSTFLSLSFVNNSKLDQGHLCESESVGIPVQNYSKSEANEKFIGCLTPKLEFE